MTVRVLAKSTGKILCIDLSDAEVSSEKQFWLMI